MSKIYFITHPNVKVEPDVELTDWGLSVEGWVRWGKVMEQSWIMDIQAVFSSTERKAREPAGVLAEKLDLPLVMKEELGEMDRSSTGFLPREEFEKVADEFFANPNESIRGWERAVDAQDRIVKAVTKIVNQSEDIGDIAIVSHGGVGGLLMCDLKNIPITRDEDQPGQGYYFVFDNNWQFVHGWKKIDEIL